VPKLQNLKEAGGTVYWAQNQTIQEALLIGVLETVGM
jgi:hypothetical protein